MFAYHRSLLALSLVASFACTVDKGDDSGGSSSDPGTDSASSAETGENPTTNIDGGTETGEPGTSGGETGEAGGNAQCIDTPQVLTLDEASALGFSGAQVLEGKLGPRASMLVFASEPTTLNDDVKGMVLPLTFELRHAGGEVRFVDSEPNPDFDDSGFESGFVECTDRLEIDVEIDFVTDAKEFDEHRDAVLTATSAERADLRVELMPPGLMGSFDVSTLYKPDAEMPTVVNSVQIGAIWDGALSGGSLLHEIQIGDDEGGIVGFGPLASWGDEIF